MKNKLLYLLLFVSLAFNVFFAIGYLRSHSRSEQVHSIEGRVALLRAELQLTAEQESILKQSQEQLQNDLAQFNGRVASRRTRYLEQMNGQFDTQKYNRFVQETEADLLLFRRQAAQNSTRFLESLSTEQKEALLRLSNGDSVFQLF